MLVCMRCWCYYLACDAGAMDYELTDSSPDSLGYQPEELMDSSLDSLGYRLKKDA